MQGWLPVLMHPILFNVNSSHVVLCTRIISNRRVWGMTGDYLIAVTAPSSSTKNLVLLSGDVVD